MKWISKSLYFINGTLVILMIISCVFSYLDPSNNQFLLLGSIAFPFLFVSCLLFLVYWLIVEPKRSLATLIGFLLCFNSIRALVNYSWGSIDEDHAVSIMSYNIGGTFFLPKEEKAKKMKWIPKEIANVNPDVIAFQESSMVKMIKDDLLEYEAHHFSDKGTSIYSKLPVLDHGKIYFGGRTNSGVWIDVKAGSKTIRIYSVHLQSNNISTDDLEALNDINRNYGDNLKDSKNVFSKYSNKAIDRVEQCKKLLKQIAKSPHPVIVCGDFNEPVFSYVYKKMAAEFQDSFIKKGRGFGATFNGKIPFLRIDYAFVDRELVVCSHEVLDWEWSDHHPIFVQITE